MATPPVLLFAPSERSSAYQAQLQTWQAHTVGSCERDLKLVEVLAAGTSRSQPGSTGKAIALLALMHHTLGGQQV
ncbi:DUF4174 domain-containing protein [Stenomitos frigidus]|uniref:DUF4174 domain-containing protein n=1 Tax=Stenomitos frigidus TaxID=1886765 RepID=UPI0011B27C3F|nr:DUF4174 domain-containing protein [Stenomitos frigidus]